MANKIQIKRTTVTGRTPNTTDPANTRYIDAGELSLNLTDGKLFSSNGTVYFEVGANLNSLSVGGDKLTANSTLVNAVALNVNNQTNTATLYVTTSANVGTAFTANSTRVNSAVNTAIAAIIANGSIGTSGQVLTTNSTGIYWSTVSTSGGSSVTISTTAPVSPSAGDLWWDSENGQLKIYYNDGDTQQWVDAASGATGATGATGAQGPAGIATGLHTIWVPAISMTSRTTNGPGSTTSESTTNKVNIKTFDFDTTTQEYAQFQIRMPKSWNEGTITFQPYWTAASGSGGVVWSLAGVALSNDDAIDTAFGTEQTSSDTLITANDIHVGPTSSAITIAGTPVAEDIIMFQVSRSVADAGDTLGVDARLIGIALFFTTDTGDDT